MSTASRDINASLLIAALRLLPKNAISRLAGRLVDLRLPARLQRAQILGFAKTFGVDLSEVKDPIESFTSLQDFFVRELVAGARTIDPAPDAFVSPCDGAWGEAGRVEADRILQVKGRPYSLAALLGEREAAARYEGGSFATLYLSPRDYHRFHSPCGVRVSRLRYIPGSLWPVNRAGVEGVESLFARNERICAFMDLPDSREGLCLVAVGATMVGKVKVDFDDLETNRPGYQLEERSYDDAKIELGKGEQWGRFEFGSTLVVITAPGLVEWSIRPPGTPVRLGERVGALLPGVAATY